MTGPRRQKCCPESELLNANAGYRSQEDIVDRAFRRFTRVMAEATVRTFLTVTLVEDESDFNKTFSSLNLFEDFCGDDSFAFARRRLVWKHRSIDYRRGGWGSRRRRSDLSV